MWSRQWQPIMHTARTRLAEHGLIMHTARTRLAEHGKIMHTARTCLAENDTIMHCATCLTEHGTITHQTRTGRTRATDLTGAILPVLNYNLEYVIPLWNWSAISRIKRSRCLNLSIYIPTNIWFNCLIN